MPVAQFFLPFLIQAERGEYQPAPLVMRIHNNALLVNSTGGTSPCS
jgi:hypothetical protein